MGKKKREHVVFEQMLKQKRNIPFSITNREDSKKQKRKSMKGCLSESGYLQTNAPVWGNKDR